MYYVHKTIKLKGEIDNRMWRMLWNPQYDQYRVKIKKYYDEDLVQQILDRFCNFFVLRCVYCIMMKIVY